MFSDLYYFPYLIITVCIYWLLPKQSLRTAFLTLSSYGFIWYFDPKAVYVVLALTVFTYLIASWMKKSRQTGLIHKIGIIGLLLVLILFKYLGFLAGIINSLLSFFHSLPVFNIEELFLPLGISYLIFKYVSYLTDIHWKVVTKGKFLDFACYGSLFTIFMAGPIERFERLKPQLENGTAKFKREYLDFAFGRIAFGLFRKLVLADWIGYFINPVWHHPDHYSAIFRVVAFFCYSFQIYFDFAGYSDIAIGSSRLFGLKIMENFDNPYQATNISQFWRRWHISLSDWIRDYLFFPMSQNRTSKLWLTFFVPVIAMGLCGLWHDAAWQYVLWGAWHGLGISLLQYWHKYSKRNKITIPVIISQAATFFFVTLGWAIFKNGTGLLSAMVSIKGAIFCLIAWLLYCLVMKVQIPLYFKQRRLITSIVLLMGAIVLFCGANTGFIYGKF